MATIEIDALTKAYTEQNNLFDQLRFTTAQLENPKNTEEDKDKLLIEIQTTKKRIEEAIAKNGTLEQIETKLRSLRQEFLRDKYVVLRGNSVKVDEAATRELKVKEATNFKIEPTVDTRNFQNENIYVSVDLDLQQNVSIMLPSIKSLGGSLNANIWVSDIGGTIGGEFSLTIIGDEDEKDTISGQESITLSDTFSGALITPIAKNQWAVFYASNIQAGGFESQLVDSVDKLKETDESRKTVDDLKSDIETIPTEESATTDGAKEETP